MHLTRRTVAILALVGVVALLVVAAGRDFASAGGSTGGKYNSMNQMKTVKPCTAQTTLEKVADKSTATLGDTITYTVTETNNAQGSCLLDTNSDGVMDTLRVAGTYVLENRSGAGSGLATNNPCDPADPRATCVLNVVDWVETHEPGAGNNWNVLNDTDCVGAGCGLEKTISGNQLDGKRNVDAYCPSHDASGNDSRGPMADLDGDGIDGGGNTLPIDKCSPDTQGRYGTLVTELAPNTSLPCGQPAGTSCYGAPQVYKYTLTVDITPAQATLLASADGIRNVAHFDMFNEQLTSSGRNHFTRASFSSASLGSNAYNVTVSDAPPQAPGDGDFCTANWPFTNCASTATGWVTNGATLPGGASGTVEVEYKVRESDCPQISSVGRVTNVANATHTDATGATGPTEAPASADTTIECAYLTATKGLVPGTAPGLVNLQIDTVNKATDVGDGGTTGSVLVSTGPHSVGETAAPGTNLADYKTSIGLPCAADGSITLAANDDQTCTITNIATRLTVEKVVVPPEDNGKFDLQIDGNTEKHDAMNGDDTGEVVVSAGVQHTVAEAEGTGTQLADYVITIDGDCPDGAITLAAGDSKTCTITNTKKGNIKIIKDAVPNSPDSFDFSCSGGLGGFALVDDGSGSGSEAKLFSRVIPGSYTCTETVPDTWGLTAISCDDGASANPSIGDPTTGIVSIGLDPGETVTCTFTDAQGNMKIIKDSQPDDAQNFHFTGLGTFDLDDDNDETLSNTQVINRGPGTYTVTESTPPAPWTLTSVSCDDPTGNSSGSVSTATATIVLDDSEEVSCTFTNSAAKVTVEKVTVPGSDPGKFNLQIDGATAGTGGNVGNGGSTGGVLVSIGNRTVSETAAGGTVLANYATTIDCGAGPVPGTSTNVSLASGEEKTCTIANSRKPTLTVNKVLSPADDPGKFNLQIDGATAGTGGNVGNGGTTGPVVVDIGSHSVGETAVLPTKLDDYTTVISADCVGNFTLAAGENKTCTITNTRKVVAPTWTASSQGFWKGSNGQKTLDADGDSVLDSPPRPDGGVCLGGTDRGKCITTIGNSDTIMDGVGNPAAQQAACSVVVGNTGCTPLDSGLTRAKLTNLFVHALALEYNIIWLNSGATTAKISDIKEDACTKQAMITDLTTLGLTTGSTVGAVRAKANQLINDSTTAVPAGVTDALVTAMWNVLSQCVNANHAVVPGDRDWDGVPEDVDNCPGINNPDQSDVDGDGIGDICDADMDNDSRGVTVGGVAVFTDAAEDYMGIDWRRDCGLDAWGPDFNGDGSVDIFDVADIKAHFNTAAGNPAYTARNDLSADGKINIVDLAVMKRFFLQTCAGVDPIQPGAP